MCRADRYPHRAVDPVDLPLMLLCWLGEYTEALAKMSYRCGPSAMQNDRERQPEREKERDT